MGGQTSALPRAHQKAGGYMTVTVIHRSVDVQWIAVSIVRLLNASCDYLMSRVVVLLSCNCVVVMLLSCCCRVVVLCRVDVRLLNYLWCRVVHGSMQMADYCLRILMGGEETAEAKRGGQSCA